MESLAALAPAQPVARTLRANNRTEALRRARVCFDHAAGRFGVAVAEALLDSGALVPAGGPEAGPADAEHPYRLGPAAVPVLTGLGVPESHLTDDRRRLGGPCKDDHWSLVLGAADCAEHVLASFSGLARYQRAGSGVPRRRRLGVGRQFAHPAQR